jgi:hypothetical protein
MPGSTSPSTSPAREPARARLPGGVRFDTEGPNDMPDELDGAPVVRLPERMDRRLRLGPFPSAGAAVKFLSYAAAGAVVAPFVSPFLWLPLVGAGFGLSVWQPDGRALDARALTYLRWKARSTFRRTEVTARQGALTRHGLVRLSASVHAAVLRTVGCPVAYLPPAELARRFGLYRDLLRSTDGRLALLATTAPIRAAPLLPSTSGSTALDHDARAGYGELVRILCRRRSLRRIYLALFTESSGPAGLARLEGEAASVVEGLSAFGLRPIRLADSELREATFRFGWSRGKLAR